MTIRRKQFTAKGAKVKRVLFTVPESMLERIDETADTYGYTRNLTVMKWLEYAMCFWTDGWDAHEKEEKQ